jgi:hypothetical protein
MESKPIFNIDKTVDDIVDKLIDKMVISLKTQIKRAIIRSEKQMLREYISSTRKRKNIKPRENQYVSSGTDSSTESDTD